MRNADSFLLSQMNRSDNDASMDSRSGNELGEGQRKVPPEVGKNSNITATASGSSEYARKAVAEEISGVLLGEQSVLAINADA